MVNAENQLRGGSKLCQSSGRGRGWEGGLEGGGNAILGDGLAGQGLHENLHTTTETEDWGDRQQGIHRQ